jgi:hypothetical protein
MHVITETTFTLSGVVRAQDGSVMANAVVQYFDPDGGPVPGPNSSTTADGNGAYTLVDLVGVPGREMGIYAYVPETELNGEDHFVVPALNQSGSVVQRDVRVCNWQLDVSLCGDWGTWSLFGNTFTVNISRVECGVTEVETTVVTILSLVNGVLTIQFEEQGEVVTAELVRVSEQGPTGVSAANVVGLYRANFGESSTPQFIAVLPGGQMAIFETHGEFATAQSGTYSATSSQLTVTFRYNNEPGSTPGETATFNYTVFGKNLTIVDGEGNEVFERCDEGPQSGVQGAWVTEHAPGDALTLFIYGGEFIAAGTQVQ